MPQAGKRWIPTTCRSCSQPLAVMDGRFKCNDCRTRKRRPRRSQLEEYRPIYDVCECGRQKYAWSIHCHVCTEALAHRSPVRLGGNLAPPRQMVEDCPLRKARVALMTARAKAGVPLFRAADGEAWQNVEALEALAKAEKCECVA